MLTHTMFAIAFVLLRVLMERIGVTSPVVYSVLFVMYGFVWHGSVMSEVKVSLRKAKKIDNEES